MYIAYGAVYYKFTLTIVFLCSLYVVTCLLKEEFKVEVIVAQNEHICVIKSHTLHEIGNSGEMKKTFNDKN